MLVLERGPPSRAAGFAFPSQRVWSAEQAHATSRLQSCWSRPLSDAVRYLSSHARLDARGYTSRWRSHLSAVARPTLSWKCGVDEATEMRCR